MSFSCSSKKLYAVRSLQYENLLGPLMNYFLFKKGNTHSSHNYKKRKKKITIPRPLTVRSLQYGSLLGLLKKEILFFFYTFFLRNPKISKKNSLQSRKRKKKKRFQDRLRGPRNQKKTSCNPCTTRALIHSISVL